MKWVGRLQSVNFLLIASRIQERESEVNWLRITLVLPVALFAANCFAADAVVTGNAVGDLIIGQSPPSLKGSRLVSRRWESDENGERYELLRVKVRGIQVDAEVYDGSIWRIWIERAGLKTLNGISVGDSADALLRNKTVHPEIGPGPSLVLIPEKPCGVSYVTDARLPDDVPGGITREFASRVVGNARITKILVVGCPK